MVSGGKKSGLSKQMEITNWLKTEHKLNHLQASLLAGLYLNNGKPVYQNEASLLDNQFAKCEEMRLLFDAISERILKQFPDTQVIPKKNIRVIHCHQGVCGHQHQTQRDQAGHESG